MRQLRPILVASSLPSRILSRAGIAVGLSVLVVAGVGCQPQEEGTPGAGGEGGSGLSASGGAGVQGGVGGSNVVAGGGGGVTAGGNGGSGALGGNGAGAGGLGGAGTSGGAAAGTGGTAGSGGPAGSGGEGSVAGAGNGGAGSSGAAGSAGTGAGLAGNGGASQAGAGGSSGGGNGTGGAASGSVPLDPALLESCTGTSPIRCTIPAPNGNHDVTVELGDPSASGSSWVDVETRHRVVDETATAAGAYRSFTFTVNVRQEQHDGGQSAPGNVLDVTIGGSAPKLRGIGVRAAPSAVTVFFAGDSTACDWVPTNSSALRDDETGWAQVLSRHFGPGVAVANYADSGETAGGFYGKFFPAARAAMKAGDYLFIQFGHNDQKNESDIDAYQSNLMRYVTDARAKNATPVIFSPVSRSGGSSANPGFMGLDQQARDLAAEESVALVDLTALSRTYYASVPDKSALFVDSGTHFSEIGAFGVAGVVAGALESGSLPLKTFLR